MKHETQCRWWPEVVSPRDHGESRVGWGFFPAGPYLLGRIFEAESLNLVAGLSGHADCGSAWSAGKNPQPARRGQPDPYDSNPVSWTMRS